MRRRVLAAAHAGAVAAPESGPRPFPQFTLSASFLLRLVSCDSSSSHTGLDTHASLFHGPCSSLAHPSPGARSSFSSLRPLPPQLFALTPFSLPPAQARPLHFFTLLRLAHSSGHHAHDRVPSRRWRPVRHAVQAPAAWSQVPCAAFKWHEVRCTARDGFCLTAALTACGVFSGLLRLSIVPCGHCCGAVASLCALRSRHS
ncbi:hypothetical protein TRVL_08174 [Trypanosoma vivax]|nr:hypothetical protein TRVL_08174 [Trypanosoma vivax]